MPRTQRSARIPRFREHARHGATGLMVAALLASFAALPAAAQSLQPIKIGVLLPKSGPYATQGENGYNGAQIAVEDFGSQVLGRKIQLVWLDEPSPQVTQQNMRKLIEEEKVVAVQGGVSSGDVLAIMPLALREKILLMATGPNATEITGKDCNQYTFRVDLPNRVTVRSTYPTLSKLGAPEWRRRTVAARGGRWGHRRPRRWRRPVLRPGHGGSAGCRRGCAGGRRQGSPAAGWPRPPR